MGKRQPGPYDDTPVYRQRGLRGILPVLRGHYVRTTLIPHATQEEQDAMRAALTRPEDGKKKYEEYE